MKSAANKQKDTSVNLVLARPMATDDFIKNRKKERNLYNYAKLRHKRIFSMGEYNNPES